MMPILHRARLLSAAALLATTVWATVGPTPAAGSPRPATVPPTGPASGAVQAFTVDQPGFYEAPNPLPDVPHGTLLRYQPYRQTALTLGGNYMRIMYTSQTATGQPVAVTGVAVLGPINGEFPGAREPEQPAGGWGVLTLGHGSVGMSMFCAPSLSLPDDGGRAFELSDVDRVVRDGQWVVVASDFEGLGTPGTGHPYLVGQSAGRNMLDAALAIGQFPGITISKTTAAVGYSQGGGAALWAGELAAAYAPELQMVATVAGAPATEVGALAGAGFHDRERSPLTLSILAGFATAYPQAAGALGSVLTKSGRTMVDVINQHCFADEVAAPRPPYLRADPAASEPFAGLFAENTPGQARQSSPVLIVQGDADENVPVDQTATLAARLCALGDTVERRMLPGMNHELAASVAMRDAVEWIEAIRSGTAPVNTCSG